MNYDFYLEAVNESLKKYLPIKDGYNDTVVDAAKYSLMGGGKRLRPVIVLSSCNAFAESFEDALPFAAAIEMVHTYSLIHDDLPAMDNDDYRRGRLSCHKQFSEWAAVLAGDGLLNTAVEIMAEAVCGCHNKMLMQRYIRALKVITQASGIYGMIAGQAADMESENKVLSEQELVNINLRKTGALISASFEAGAIIGGAGETECADFAEAGRKIGVSFQIKDDMLDYYGEFKKTGKPIGSDSKNNKSTYVTVFGLDRCAETVKKLSGEAACLISGVKGNTRFLESLIMELVNREC